MDKERIQFLEDTAMTFAILGVLLYEEPTKERLSEFLEADFSEQAFVQGQAEIDEGLIFLAQWAAYARELPLQDVADELAVEWLKLLVGIGTPLAAPWASYYLEREPVVLSKWTLEVREWYARYGLMLEKKNNEPDDHLGLMLQFLSMLASKECEALKVEDTETALRHYGEQREFAHRFINPWVGVWQQRVSDAKVGDYYKGLALVAVGMLSLYRDVSIASALDEREAGASNRTQELAL